jgi:serine O-acetyltransferase
MPEANPWHFMEFVNPVSRPLLTLSALAPSPAAALAQSALATASAADALGFERVAIAGATFVYGVNLFRGVGLEAGGPRAVMRELREFRRGMEQLGTRRRGGGVGLRGLLEAIEEDHRMLVRNADHYDPRRRTISSPASTFVTNSGFQLVVSYRVMRHLRSLELPLATRALARGMRHAFGSDVHWDADLEPGLVVIHGFGLAISFAARAAHGCVLSQNVTLGIGRDGETGEIGAPSLGEDVIVGPNSTLTGPIAIGAGTKIGAGCTVHTSVPPRTIVEAPAPAMRPRRP